MDLLTYKWLHIIGLLALFFAFGGLTLGARTAGGRIFSHRRLYVILHGIGLFFLLVSGFGLLARLGITSDLPHWVIVKLIVWVTLGLMLSLVFRKPQWARAAWVAILVIGAFAAWLGIYKPF